MICLHEFESPLEQLWVRPGDILFVHSGAPSGAPGGASVMTSYGKLFHVFESAEDVARLVGGLPPAPAFEVPT